MMFLTLVPKLLQEARLVGISVSSRLFPFIKDFADFIDNSSVDYIPHKTLLIIELILPYMTINHLWRPFANIVLLI